MVEESKQSVGVVQYAIALLAEEAAETTQMVGKWLRFGPDHARRDGLTARRGLSMEAGDLLAAIDYAVAAGVLDSSILAGRRSRKLARLIDPASVDDEGRRLAPPINIADLMFAPSPSSRMAVEATHG